MNKVILLVGPPGSGKSTVAKKWNDADQYYIISQDAIGPKYFEEYEKALFKEDRHIIVDRINHTREQRKRYIDLAKQHGYKTEIFLMNHPFGLCFDRIVNRDGHPTIKQGDRATAIQALRMYFSQYERPTPEEADLVVYATSYDPYLLDLNNIVPLKKDDRRFIIIGDLHGCYDELMELLDYLKWNFNEDVIIFTGDIIDRGPKIKECLQFVMNTPNVFTIMSNHENKLARHLATLGADLVSKVKFGHGFMKTIDQCKDIFDDKFLGWIWSLPYIIKFGKNYVVHAGVNPKYTMARQSKDFLIYARKYDIATNSYGIESSPNWYEHQAPPGLNGGRIFFGHNVHEKLPETLNHGIPVDGGCVFGGSLRAAIVIGDSLSFVEVDSHQIKEVDDVPEVKEAPVEKKVSTKITPLSIYEIMCTSKDFLVPSSYILSVPDERRQDVLDIAFKLIERRFDIIDEIEAESMKLLAIVGLEPTDFPSDPDWKKKIGQALQSKEYGGKHAAVMIPFLSNNLISLEKYVRKVIRPISNTL